MYQLNQNQYNQINDAFQITMQSSVSGRFGAVYDVAANVIANDPLSPLPGEFEASLTWFEGAAGIIRLGAGSVSARWRAQRHKWHGAPQPLSSDSRSSAHAFANFQRTRAQSQSVPCVHDLCVTLLTKTTSRPQAGDAH